MCLKVTFRRRCKYSFSVQTSPAAALLTPANLSSPVPPPAGHNARGHLRSCGTRSCSTSTAAAQRIPNAHMAAPSPCDRTQPDRTFGVSPASPPQPPRKGSETLFRSSGRRAGCLLAGEPGAYRPPGEEPYV